MGRLRKVSGKRCVAILSKGFGFSVVRQSGSHVVLRKEVAEGALGTVVPMHKELKIGTLKGLLKLAHVDENDFADHL